MQNEAMGHGSDGRAVERSGHPEQAAHREGSYGSLLSGVATEIDNAPEGALIFVSGLLEHERDTVENAVHANGIRQLKEFDGFESVHATAEQNAKGKLIYNRADLLERMLFGTEGIPEAKGRELLERTEDPAMAIAAWRSSLEAEGGGIAPEIYFAELIDRLRRTAGEDRSIHLALPAKSPLALALLTFAREGTLDEKAVARTYERYPMSGDALASVRMRQGVISAAISGTPIGSRLLG